MPKKRKVIFLENPYDVETVFESMQIAGEQGKELLYMDRLIATIRLDPEADLTNLNYKILHDLQLLELETMEY
jgi:hypothetical protein